MDLFKLFNYFTTGKIIFEMCEIPDYDANSDGGNSCRVKVICLGDSAVGKSK